MYVETKKKCILSFGGFLSFFQMYVLFENRTDEIIKFELYDYYSLQMWVITQTNTFLKFRNILTLLSWP